MWQYTQFKTENSWGGGNSTSKTQKDICGVWHVLNSQPLLCNCLSVAIDKHHSLYFHCGSRCSYSCWPRSQGHLGVKCGQSISLCLLTGSDLVHNRAYLYLKWIPLQAEDIELHNSISWHVGLQLGCCSFLKPSGHCHSNELHPRYFLKLFRKKESVSTLNAGWIRLPAKPLEPWHWSRGYALFPRINGTYP